MMRVLQPFLAHFAYPQALWLLCAFPLVWTLGLIVHYRRARAFARLGSVPALRALAVVGRWRRVLISACSSLAFAFLVIGVAGPHWGQDPQPTLATGRDLALVVDVSRSMLAEDVLPSRVEWAKQALAELVDEVQRRGGYRLGLVAFAGRSRVICPLTPDYDHFREALVNLDPRDTRFAPGPGEDLPASGTRIGEAVTEAVQLHEPRFRGFQDVLLLSDGDDPARDDEWQRGAQTARAAGIPVHAVGIGDPQTDSTIQDLEGRPLRFKGENVLTRLQEKPLEELARLTGGKYFPAWRERRPLESWFSAWSRARPGHDFGAEPLPTLVPRYAWFFGPALAFCALAILVSDRSRPRPGNEWQPALYVPNAAWMVLVALSLVSATPRLDADQWIRLGNADFDRGAYEEALDSYRRAEEHTIDPGLVALNQAAALYRLGRYREAELHYVRALEDAAGARRRRALFDLGNALVQEGQGNDAALLDRAIASYQACLKEPQLAPELLEDARHNLQVAQTLRQRAKIDAHKRPEGARKNHAEREQRPPDPRRNGKEAGADTPDSRGQLQQAMHGQPAKDGTALASSQRQPGTGALPPIPDSDELRPLAPEDALAHLRQATQRIMNELHKQKLQTTRPTRNVLDW